MEISNGIFLWDLTLSSHYSDSKPDNFVVSKQTSSQQENVSVKSTNNITLWPLVQSISIQLHCVCTYVQNYVLKWKRFANSLFFFPALWKNFILIKFPFLRSHSITPSGVYRSESLGELDISSFSAIHFHLLLCIARYMIIVCYSLH